MSGQYAANSVFWLATRGGKMERYCSPGHVHFVPTNKIFAKIQAGFFCQNYFLLRLKDFCDFSVSMEPEKASTRIQTKKTKMLMSFKNTFSNKNRQTQKFVFNLNIWKFELHAPRIVATKPSPPSQNPGSFPDFTYSLQSEKRTQSYRSISHHQRQKTSTLRFK